MFRLLGFLIGSVTAIIIILLILGIPDFHMPGSGIDQQRFDAAVEKLKEKQQEAAEIADVIVDDVVTTVASVQHNIETVMEKALPELPAQLPPIQDTHESIAAYSATRIQDTHDPTAPGYPAIDGDYALGIDELQWYSFWNPFRSQIAASGFVSQLEKVTGLEYRVVKVKTGVYEVAFAYSDDMERRTKLSRISAATGLDLSGS